MPGGMVKVEILDCLLWSIRRRVKHVKEGLSIDFDEQRRLGTKGTRGRNNVLCSGTFEHFNFIC